MFFKQLRQQTRQDRQDNRLYFSSLVVAIVAFYTLLSLPQQDVMLYLRTLESEALQKLFTLLPLVFFLSLFFVFCLVYLANKAALERRRKQLGLYLMSGMRPRRLFARLMLEALWNSGAALLLGLPLALLLTEATSLVTAKIIGLDLLQHHFSLDLSALWLTIMGFSAVLLLSMALLSSHYCRQVPANLLRPQIWRQQRPGKQWVLRLALTTGVALLLLAYVGGICWLRRFDLWLTALILLAGICGTFLLYQGLGGWLGRAAQQRSRSRSGLAIFNQRELQEHALYEHRTLAVASLLALLALSCVSFGIGTGFSRLQAQARTVDFSIEATQEEVTSALAPAETQQDIAALYPMYLSYFDFQDSSAQFSWSQLTSAIRALPASEAQQSLLTNLANRDAPYLIALSSYNNLCTSAGLPTLTLSDQQALLYTGFTDSQALTQVLPQALNATPTLQINGQAIQLLPRLESINLVADRAITIYLGLIVSDRNYQRWSSDKSLNQPFCWNLKLSEQLVEQDGLIQAISRLQQPLDAAGLTYDSYLSGIGRRLFYTVAASYLTIYLGVLFLIIANTLSGLKYLQQLQQTSRRWQTLLLLGAQITDLQAAWQKQIIQYFGLVMLPALISALFAITAMFTSFLKLPAGVSLGQVAAVSAAALLGFAVIEWLYIRSIQHSASRQLQQLASADRDGVFE